MKTDFAALADEIEQARQDHLGSYGGSPKVVAKKRAALEQILRADVCTIVEALRLAASTFRQGE